MKSSSRIFLNTSILYGKMMITMLLTLLSTRWVLASLGASNFGIYNLVAGLIAMFSFLNTAMAVASQRYLSYAIGAKSEKNLKKTFYYSVIQHLFIGCVVILILEILGSFFLNSILNIPNGKESDALFVLHCLAFSTFLTIITVPYQAIANAHENMLIIALISIVESILKFAIALYLLNYLGNRLRMYALLMVVVSFVSMSIIRIFCKKKYSETHIEIKRITDIAYFKNFLFYALWNLIGALGGIIKNQGIAMILNVFYGVIVNAAYGIANQVNGQLSFLSNTMVKAIQPQLMQSEGAGDRQRMLHLSIVACKLPTFLLIVLLIPLAIEMDYILELWLKNVPKYAVSFCQIILAYTIVYQSYHGIELSIHACGKIKNYQIWGYGIQILVLPLGYCALKMGFYPESVLFISLFCGLINLFVTVYFAHKIAGLNVLNYIKSYLIPIYSLMTFSLLICCMLNKILPANMLGLVSVYLVNTVFVVTLFWVIGMDNADKLFVKSLINKIMNNSHVKKSIIYNL